MKNIFRSRLTTHVIVGGLGFTALVLVFNLNPLIIMLNGLFGGSIAGLMVAYGPLIYAMFRGREPATRAQELAFGFFALWVAYVLAVYVSVWTRSIGEPTANPSYISALSRYIAVYAAVRQVTAPDYGLGLMYGRDRKLLWVSLLVGLVVAVALWVIQDQALLSGLVADVFARSQLGFVRPGFGGRMVAAV
jgi:hypothetical protein